VDSKVFPPDVPNSTSILSHLVWPQFNFHILKCKAHSKAVYEWAFYVGKVSNIPEELVLKWVVLKWVDDDCGALPIKKKNYYRCTHTPAHPLPPLPSPPSLPTYLCNSKMKKVPYRLIIHSRNYIP